MKLPQHTCIAYVLKTNTNRYLKIHNQNALVTLSYFDMEKHQRVHIIHTDTHSYDVIRRLLCSRNDNEAHLS